MFEEKTLKEKLIHEINYMCYLQGMETKEKEMEQAKKKAYDEGYAAGKRDALEAMRTTAHSHKPQHNIYASRFTAFERRPEFVDSAPELCGNCAHWEHETRSDSGRCDITDEPRLSCIRCNVMRG